MQDDRTPLTIIDEARQRDRRPDSQIPALVIDSRPEALKDYRERIAR